MIGVKNDREVSESKDFERINELARVMGHEIKVLCPDAKTGLDIGCQKGQITEIVSNITGISFFGIEPDQNEVQRSSRKVRVIKGYANDLPFANSSFDVVMIISVLEHITPQDLNSSFQEMFRVLKPGGYIVGQIPNMNFPIEVHSHLPFQQFLPTEMGNRYLRLFSKGRYLKSEWYRISKKKISKMARSCGFEKIFFTSFLYPKEVFPKFLLPLYPILKVLPLDYIFSFRK